MLGGAALLLLAAAAPFTLLRMVPIVEAGVVAHLEGAGRRAVSLPPVARQALQPQALAGLLVGGAPVEGAPIAPPGPVGGSSTPVAAVNRGRDADGTQASPDKPVLMADAEGDGWHDHVRVLAAPPSDGPRSAGSSPVGGPPTGPPALSGGPPALSGGPPGCHRVRAGVRRPHPRSILVRAMAQPRSYGFSPLEQRGVVAGLRSGQLAILVATLVAAVIVLRVWPDGLGIGAVAGLALAASAVAFAPVRGLTVEQWAPDRVAPGGTRGAPRPSDSDLSPATADHGPSCAPSRLRPQV